MGKEKCWGGGESRTSDQVSCLQPPFIKSMISFAVGCLFPFGPLAHAVQNKAFYLTGSLANADMATSASFHPPHHGQVPLTRSQSQTMERVDPCDVACSTSFSVTFGMHCSSTGTFLSIWHFSHTTWKLFFSFKELKQIFIEVTPLLL